MGRLRSPQLDQDRIRVQLQDPTGANAIAVLQPTTLSLNTQAAQQRSSPPSPPRHARWRGAVGRASLKGLKSRAARSPIHLLLTD